MRLTLGNILQFLILTTVSIAFFGFLLSEESHPYVDWKSHLYFLGLSLLLVAACRKSASHAPIVLILVATLYAFVISRISFLYLYPDGFLGFERLAPEFFSGTLLYLLLSTSAAIAACLVVESVGRLKTGTKSRHFAADFVNQRAAVLFLLAICMLKLFTFFFDETYGFSGATGSGEHLGIFDRYLAFLINPLAACLVALVAVAHGSRTGQTRSRAILMCVGAFASYLALSGSRSSTFEGVLVVIAFWVIFWGNSPVRVPKVYLVATGALFLLSIAVWPLVTAFRELVWYGDRDILSSIPVAFEAAYSTKQQGVLEKLAPISQRVSLIESTVYPLYAEELGFGGISDLVNLETVTWGTLSRVLPGNIFGEYLFGEYAFGYFLGRSGVRYDSSKLVNFVGYEWGMFGISYQVFGYLGGLVAIFVVTGTIAAMVRVFRSRPEPWAHLISLFFCYTMNSWVHNLGFDNLIDRTVRTGFVILIYAVLLGVVQLRSSPKRRGSIQAPFPYSIAR